MNTSDRTIRITNFIIAIGSLFLFAAFNGGMHLFDWDEINFAESAREMIVTGDYSTVQINFQPFWEKPPLFIWMQVLAMKIFGINEFAARFPNAVCGMATLLLLFNFGRKLFGYRFGLIWMLTYAGSLLSFLYFKSGIIDPWFNLLIYASIYMLMQYTDTTDQSNKLIKAILSGVLIGFATLTKGPVALLMLGLTAAVFLLYRKFKVKIVWWHVLAALFSALFVGCSWFIIQWLAGNGHIIEQFIAYQVKLFNTQDAGHGGFLLYHFVFVILGVFPASVFMLASLRFKNEDEREKHYFLWNLILMLVVLITFTIVKTKIMHYSSLSYFPLTFLAALFINRQIEKGIAFQKWIIYASGVLIFIYASTIALLSFIDSYKHILINRHLIKDPFAEANLQADGGWMQIEWITSAVLLIGFILFILKNKQKKIQEATGYLFGSSILFIFLSMVLIVPKIEKYSQAAAIEFCESVADKDVYVNTLGYKSYANYFYANRQPPGVTDQLDWLQNLKEAPEKELYLIFKTQDKKEYLEMFPNLVLLNEKNGFVFARWGAKK